MFNTIVVLALIALFIWNLIQREQLKNQAVECERVKYNAKAFEIRTLCVEYFNQHGSWPDIKALRENREGDSLDNSLWANWVISARFEKIYTKQWLLEVWIPDEDVRRIFHTGIRTAA